MDRMPSRTVFIVHITRDEYPLFRAGLPMDTRLPASYDDWYKAALHTHRIHRAAALDTTPVTVHWDEFIDYAQRIRLSPSFALLTTFAISLGHRRRASTLQ